MQHDNATMLTPPCTPVQRTAFVVKNTFVDDASEPIPVLSSRRRSSSVPPPRSPMHETPESWDAVKTCALAHCFQRPASASESTACSEDAASLEDCEDPVLEALPADVRVEVVKTIEAVFRQRSMSVEGCELEMDDEEDEDRMVRATFSVLGESDDQMSLIKRPLPPALVTELGPERLEQHNDTLRLAVGGPFRRTLVDLAFVSA